MCFILQFPQNFLNFALRLDENPLYGTEPQTTLVGCYTVHFSPQTEGKSTFGGEYLMHIWQYLLIPKYEQILSIRV